MSDPKLTQAVNEVRAALEGYTEDCIASDKGAQRALQKAWDCIRLRLSRLEVKSKGKRGRGKEIVRLSKTDALMELTGAVYACLDAGSSAADVADMVQESCSTWAPK